jgi:hypothetical protein
MKHTEDATAQARQFLLSILKPGDTVQTILRHRSRSGMSRSISLVKDGKDISYYVAQVLDMKIDQNHSGIKIGGCGMDMGFELVYTLSRVLFRDNFTCIGKDCPANDHVNSPYPDRKAGSMKHSDAGYALRQEWL